MKTRRISIIIASALLACLLLVGFAGCSDKNERKSDSFVRLDINPSIELVVDADNKIVSVYGANTDGTVLLYGETDKLIGKDFDEAITQITDMAVELGYLSEDNKVVQYSVTSPDGEEVEKLLSASIDMKVTATAKSLGLTVSTDASGAYSLLRKFNEFKTSHPDNEAVQKMSVAEFRLALSASETGEITLEAAVELNDEELVNVIKKASEKVKEFATNEYQAAVAAADKVYEAAVSAALDGIYATYYSAHVATHPTTWYYGYVYQMYATAAHGTKALEGIYMLKDKISAITLDEEAVKSVLTSLGLTEDDVELLKDADGNVTLESVYAYADKTFKNSETGADIEELKVKLDAALKSAETYFSEERARFMKEYEPQITAVYNAAVATADMVKALINNPVVSFIPENVKAIINEMIAAADELKATLTKEDLSVEDIKALTAKYEKKAKDTLEIIKNDLTEEEKAEVEQIRAKAEERLTKAKETYDNAIARAEKFARDTIEKLRKERVCAQQAK